VFAEWIASASPATFSMAYDRTAQWQISNGSFRAGIYHLRAIDFRPHQRRRVGGRT
jgi:hypothetical protein